MSNISKEDTGLPYDIWIDDSGKDRKVRYNSPRLKVDLGNGKSVSIKIDERPVVLAGDKTFRKSKEVLDWVSDNSDILLKHWNKEMSTSELISALIKEVDK